MCKVHPYSDCSCYASYTALSPAPSEVNIDLDVIQDSIPQGKKSKTAKQVRHGIIYMLYSPCYSVILSSCTPSTLLYTFSSSLHTSCVCVYVFVCVQKAAKPRYPKEKHQGLHKKPTPPAPVLSRSLLHNLSANTSKGSLAMDKDPYAFDSEDEVPDLPLTVSKGRKIPGRKWHEEEEEEKLPRVREKKRVYSNKVCYTGTPLNKEGFYINYVYMDQFCIPSIFPPLWYVVVKVLFVLPFAGKSPTLILSVS